LKRDDKPRVFDSYLDAMAACRDAREKTSLRGGVTPSGRPVPHQSFEVKEYTQ
jgi:hypothetical protein